MKNLLFVILTALSSAWQPLVQVNDMYSDYYIAMDAETGQILAGQNYEDPMYPASMTKMMTVLIALDHVSLSDTITITPDMLAGLTEANASVAGYSEGDEVSAEDLLYGTALPSGADCANALAITSCGSIDAFVKEMNEKAQALDMANTHFANPTGLHEDDHYSSCHDIAKLVQTGIQNETFRKIFSTTIYYASPTASLPFGLTFYSTSILLHELNPDLVGGKTGYTLEAGRCYAAWSKVNDLTMITVTAHAMQDGYPMFDDYGTLINSISDYQRISIANTDQLLKTYTEVHTFKKTKEKQVYMPENLSMDLPNDTVVSYSTDFPDQIVVTNEIQEIPFTITIANQNQEVISEKTYIFTVPAEEKFFYRLWNRLFGNPAKL